jgi:DHA1 family bicyclomycin/chloramphenicol resistance-like MFS transporter
VSRPPLWLLVTITIGASVGMHLMVPALPVAAADLGVSAGRMQLSFSVYLLTLALGQLLWGPVSDSVGRRRALIVGTSLFALGGLAGAIAPSLELLLVARVVQALGAACGMSLGRAIIRDTSEGVEMVRQLALLALIVLLSPGLAPMLGGAIAHALGWRVLLGLLGALGLFSVWMTVRRLPETCPSIKPFDARRIAADYGSLVHDLRFTGLALGTAGLNTAAFAFLAAAPVLLTRQMGLGLAEVGLCSGLVMMGLALGNALTSLLVRRIAPHRLAAAGLLLALAGALALLALEMGQQLNLANMLIALVTMNCGAGMVSPVMTARAYTFRPTQAGTAAGVQGCALMVMATASGSLVNPDLDPAHSCAVVMLSVVVASCGCIGLATYLARRRA